MPRKLAPRPAAIRALFDHRGPAEVAGSVVGFVIYPVNGVEGIPARVLPVRPWAYLGFHAGNEHRDVMPGFADADAPTAIVPVGGVVDVVAATHHPPPGLVQRMEGESVPPIHGRRFTVRVAAGRLFGCLPGAQSQGPLMGTRPRVDHARSRGDLRLLLRRPRPRGFALDAAARLSSGRSVQAGDGNGHLGAAVAQAQDGSVPCRFLGRRPAAKAGLRDHEPAETLANLNEHARRPAHFWPPSSGSSGSDDSRRSRTTALADLCSVYAASRSRSCSSSGRSMVIRFMGSMIPEKTQTCSSASRCTVLEMAS